MNMFEYAVRNKLRFSSSRGLLTAEDLWDLPLTSTVRSKVTLNSVAKLCLQELKELGEEDFVAPTSTNEREKTKLELIKYVIEERLLEKEKEELAKQRKQQKEAILQIINTKKTKSLEEKSIEELTAMLND